MPLDPISIGLGAIQGLTSLGGLLGASAERQRAEQARQQAIAQMSQQLDTQYQQMIQRNNTSLAAAAGTGGDAIASLGRRLGSSLAGAGVYNSSATAGALQQAQAAQDASLSNLAAQNTYNQQALLGENQRYLTGLKLGLANSQYDQSLADQSAARGGLSSFLGTLGQYNLSRSGAHNTQNSLPRAYGGYGNPSVLSLPQTGNYNPDPFSLNNILRPAPSATMPYLPYAQY